VQFDYYEDGGWEEFGAGSELLNTTLTERVVAEAPDINMSERFVYLYILSRLSISITRMIITSSLISIIILK